MTEPRQLVLDVVVGIDDALMMLMHLSEPAVENIAVGSNHGRCHLHRHPCRHIARCWESTVVKRNHCLLSSRLQSPRARLVGWRGSNSP